MASSAMPAETASASAAPTETAPPPPPPLPADFTAAMDARKAADAKFTAIITKDGKCDALATELTKFTKDNSAAYVTYNGAWAKLTDEQKKQATTGGAMSAPPDASGASGGFKTCVEKKDKKVEAALKAFTTAATKAPAAAAGSAAPKASGTPKAAPKK